MYNEPTDKLWKGTRKKIQTCMATLKTLDLFWLHSDCPARIKIITVDAVIRAKLLYEMESAQLGEPELKRLDQIHLKAMRKILGYKTTFVDREKTNAKVYRDLNERVKDQGSKK